MRILKIDNTFVDIDSQTAIGINFQKYDIKNPGTRKFNISNSFTIPKTSKNLKLLGFADNFQTTDNSIYDKFIVNYWVDNNHFIKDGEVRIEEISNRIKLYVVEKKDFWETLKDYKYTEFVPEYLAWLRSEKGEYYFGGGSVNFFSGTFSQFIDRYANNNTQDHFILPYYYSEYLNYTEGETWETDNEGNLYVQGGRFCTYIKSIFEFLEYKYDVDFLRTSTDDTLIWSDSFFNATYIPIRNIGVYMYNVTDGTQWVIGERTSFMKLKGPERKDKSIYSLIKAVFQKFNVIIDDYYDGDIYKVEIRRFDDIKTKAPVVNFSGNLVLDKIKMKPSIDGYNQINRILYETVYPDGPETSGAKLITCNNKNLDKISDLFKIDDYFPAILENTNEESVLDLSTEESLETWVILISSSMTSVPINVNYSDTYSYADMLEIAAVYGLDGEYQFIEEILSYPKIYEVYKWLTLNDIINLDFFKQYFVRELGGSFFINKIQGFNPEKSNQPTKIELLRISDKVPKPVDVYLEEFYVDGVGNAFVDGAGTIFYDDWFLPSRDELNAMYTNLHVEGVGNFENERYFSSSEYNSTRSTYLSFDNGIFSSFPKSESLSTTYVRPCRSFIEVEGLYSLRDVGPAGGLIFYINGTTYYEAAANDIKSPLWSNIAQLVGTGTAIGTGQQNTQDIINQAGHTDSAALLCEELSISVDTDNDNYFI